MAVQSVKFSVTILGSNSALPANGRNPTAQLLNVNNHYYLIDCGEGTQMQLRRYGLKMQRIKCIFISHMHGDHYFGLVGLLNSFHLLGRSLPLEIFSPPELKPIIELQLKASGGKLQYPIEFHDITPFSEGKVELYSDAQLRVDAFNLKHRITCYGFCFTEQEKQRSYLPEIGGPLGVRLEDIPRLKKGEDVKLEDGTIIHSTDVTAPPLPTRRYAYCTDTLPLDSTAEHVRGSEVLYHEATFLQSEQKRSKQTYHSTAQEAAQVAKSADVGALILGHYSARYGDLNAHIAEASEIFENVYLAVEGKEFDVN